MPITTTYPGFENYVLRLNSFWRRDDGVLMAEVINLNGGLQSIPFEKVRPYKGVR